MHLNFLLISGWGDSGPFWMSNQLEKNPNQTNQITQPKINKYFKNQGTKKLTTVRTFGEVARPCSKYRAVLDYAGCTGEKRTFQPKIEFGRYKYIYIYIYIYINHLYCHPPVTNPAPITHCQLLLPACHCFFFKIGRDTSELQSP